MDHSVVAPLFMVQLGAYVGSPCFLPYPVLSKVSKLVQRVLDFSHS